ncbi:hypothetical protein PHLCEN_2v9236 [Hermanssonia centrifuga]|uniref:4a-hydroxytetrahydrobiopterin dehydratase n=1 Tax=Hermanssonia centrifuga TaxID=98765 RepID=A0A2R6NRF0_9APHY|nr:hypothetical protein PHLCEN_2v9236 [Hermanssonia centrifuga]
MLARARTIARVPVAQHLRSTRKRTSSAVLRNLSSSFLPVRTEPILLVSVARYSTDATGAKTRAHPYDQPVSVVSEITEESTESLSMENKSDVASEPVSNLISAAPAMWLELFADEFDPTQFKAAERRAELLKNPLPDSPRRPKWPAPWLTDEQMKSFLLPLFARGWRISPDPDSSELQVELGSVESVVRLKTRYRFAQSYHAIAFVKECLEIMEKLHHHARLTIDNSIITLATHTHSAYVEDREVENPGITLHDVRLAYGVQRLWETYQNAGKVDNSEVE